MAGLNEIKGDEKLSALVRSLYGVSAQDAGNRDLATVIFKEEVRCIQCGLCVKRCPTGAITMEEYHRPSTYDREDER